MKAVATKIVHDKETFQPALEVIFEIPLEAVMDARTFKNDEMIVLMLGKALMEAVGAFDVSKYVPQCDLTKDACDEREGYIDNYCPVHGRDIR